MRVYYWFSDGFFMDRIHNKKTVMFVYAALALAVVAAFEPVRHNSFVEYDDDQYITGNRHVIDGLTSRSAAWAFTNTETGNWHPVTWLSHMLDCQLYGLNPVGHHLTNVLFHLANTLMLFWILKKMTGSMWASLFAAALFGLHPLRVESVAWAAERKDVLSAFFWILTTIVYFRYTKCPGIGKYLLIVVVFILGLMSKSMLVTLPFALLLLDYWPLKRLSFRVFLEKIPLFIISAVLCIIAFITQKSAGATDQLTGMPLSFSFINAVVSYTRYLSKMFFPHKLAVMYPFPITGFSQTLQIVSFVTIITITLMIIFTARSKRYLFTGWFWYLGVMVPVIGVVQIGIQSMADRYTYLPSIGICIILAFGIADIALRFNLPQNVMRVSGLLILVILMLCTRMQIGHWKDTSSLYKHATEVTENNYYMHNSYGRILANNGYFDEAFEQFDLTLQINPTYAEGHCYIGEAYRRMGKVDAAIINWSNALKYDPDHDHALNNLAWIRATHPDSDMRDPDEALMMAKKACRLTEYQNVGYVDTLAAAFAASGEFASAITSIQKAIDLAISNGQERDIADMKAKLELYKANRQYFDNSFKRYNAKPGP